MKASELIDLLKTLPPDTTLGLLGDHDHNGSLVSFPPDGGPYELVWDEGEPLATNSRVGFYALAGARGQWNNIVLTPA